MYAKSRYSEPVERYQVWGKGEKEALKKKDAPKEKKPAPNKEKAPKKKAESSVYVVDDDTDEDSDQEVEWMAVKAAKTAGSSKATLKERASAADAVRAMVRRRLGCDSRVVLHYLRKLETEMRAMRRNLADGNLLWLVRELRKIDSDTQQEEQQEEKKEEREDLQEEKEGAADPETEIPPSMRGSSSRTLYGVDDGSDDSGVPRFRV